MTLILMTLNCGTSGKEPLTTLSVALAKFHLPEVS
jgi:hypothetical protein